jgi:sec-independent protein translocase protein TatB
MWVSQSGPCLISSLYTHCVTVNLLPPIPLAALTSSMFGLGFSEIAVIFIVMLLVFGPERLPDIAKTAGRVLGDLRRTLDEMKREYSLPSMVDLLEEELPRSQVIQRKETCASASVVDNTSPDGHTTNESATLSSPDAESATKE